MRLIGFTVFAACLAVTTPLSGQDKARARDLGIPFDGTPGPLNAITDVAGVEVGVTTLIEGEAVRTGVTAILPRGKMSADPTFAGWFSLNGNGEMTGTTWIEEGGFLEARSSSRTRTASASCVTRPSSGVPNADGSSSRGRCPSWPRPTTAHA